VSAAGDGLPAPPAEGPARTPKGRATRARLLAAAARQLATEGRVEVAAVARSCEVAPSVLYRYFPGRDGLAAAVVEAFYDEYQAAVFDRSLEDDPALPRDAGWMAREELRLEREVAFLYGHPLGRAVAAGLLHDAAATRVDAARLREHVAQAARNIRHGQRAGDLDAAVDAGLAAAAIIGALRTVLAEALSRDPPPPPASVVDAVVRIGRALLLPAVPARGERARARRDPAAAT